MTARLIAPATIKAGDQAEVKLSILHPMELGTRRLDDGSMAARNVIETLRVTFENETVLSLALGTGIAANPYWAFSFAPPKSGVLLVRWRDTAGVSGEARTTITVS
jgi:Sulphur oxidation protein SoxZ